MHYKWLNIVQMGSLRQLPYLFILAVILIKTENNYGEISKQNKTTSIYLSDFQKTELKSILVHWHY